MDGQNLTDNKNSRRRASKKIFEKILDKMKNLWYNERLGGARVERPGKTLNGIARAKRKPRSIFDPGAQ